MERQKIEQRRYFSKAEKEAILKKSQGHCSHCGTKLTASTMTIDHFIPIVQGGTNDEDNLIALCEDCNKLKGKTIYKIEDYCKHLGKHGLKQLDSYVQRSYQTFKWISPNNIFSEDVITMSINFDIMQKSGIIIKQKRKVKLFRVTYNDLDDVLAYLEVYNTVYNVDCHGVELKNAMIARFVAGAYYCLKDSKGSIQILFVLMPKIRENDHNGCCFLSEIYLNPNLKLSVTSMSDPGDYSPSKSVFFYYCNIVTGFFHSFVEQFDVECAFDFVINLLESDKYLVGIINNVSTTHIDITDIQEDLKKDGSCHVSLFVASRIATKKYGSSIVDNEPLTLELLKAGSIIVLEHLEDSTKWQQLMNSTIDTSNIKLQSERQAVFDLLEDFTVCLLKKLHSEEPKIHVNGYKDGNSLHLAMDYGVLKSVHIFYKKPKQGKYKISVLPMIDLQKQEEYDFKDECYYFYLSRENFEEQAYRITRLLVLDYDRLIEDLGERQYNRTKWGNKRCFSNLYKPVDKEFNLRL